MTAVASAPQGLLTDMYQLSMMQAYLDHGMTETAVFELFFRTLPPSRRFLVAAGLDQALDFLETLGFTQVEIDWLDETGQFSRDFLDYLAGFRFSGDVHAMQEGTIFYPDEPVIRVTAPLPQAQLVETRLMNLLHFQTVIASKASRMVLAADGKRLIDFGFRRAHGAEAGILSARAAYIGGFAATATLSAARTFGIPASGTMAHSFIQAHGDEAAAFAHFADSRPEGLVLLIDTYDTEAGARKVAELAPKLAARGITVSAVRIDSGDLGTLAKRVRTILDDAGLQAIGIVASGGIDEHRIVALRGDGAPIDGYGIGTSLATPEDAPALDCAYKLQAYAGIARRKRSAGKATWPGAKQVYRSYDRDGRMSGDLLTVDEDVQPGVPLIKRVMRAGRRTVEPSALDHIRAHAAAEREQLPAALADLGEGPVYPVTISDRLRRLAEEVDRRTG
ncbi:MAG: nicotinate phosphoribosyltransferase [Rhodospirillaceae bacterium]|nr:nicotinate phosphoribosyltransferase [Rhodospirillaceae bacterium]